MRSKVDEDVKYDTRVRVTAQQIINSFDSGNQNLTYLNYYKIWHNYDQIKINSSIPKEWKAWNTILILLSGVSTMTPAM